MAKAQFHKNQRVYVRTVGTWALVEKVIPQWTKGLDEPLRIFYELGLGREFTAEELQSEAIATSKVTGSAEQWRLVRAPNKWKSPEECAHHPHPGTHPVVMTGDTDWGGWRVPGAEYDLHPQLSEHQARMIVNAPRMASLLNALLDTAKTEPENMPEGLAALVTEARAILRYIDQEAPQ